MTASWTHGPRESLETQLKDKIAYREDLLNRLALVEDDIRKIRERLD
jgi:hypothetical protein